MDAAAPSLLDRGGDGAGRRSQRGQDAFGVRAAMRAWVGHLDEITIDRLHHGDLTREQLVELATTMLVAALRGALALDDAAIDPALVEQLRPS